MALSPSDLAALTSEDIAVVGKLEKLIDEKLQLVYEPGGSVTLNLSNMADSINCNRVSFKMRNELMSRYEKSGWALNFDPSKNDFLTFVGPVAAPPKADIVPADLSVDQMLDNIETQSNAASAPRVKPPSFTPVNRGSENDPYKRSNLASKP